MEHHYGRMLACNVRRTNILRMDSCSSYTRKIKIEAFCIRHLECTWHKLELRIDCMHFRNRSIPILVKVFRTWIRSVIRFSFLYLHIYDWHHFYLIPSVKFNMIINVYVEIKTRITAAE